VSRGDAQGLLGSTGRMLGDARRYWGDTRDARGMQGDTGTVCQLHLVACTARHRGPAGGQKGEGPPELQAAALGGKPQICLKVVIAAEFGAAHAGALPRRVGPSPELTQRGSLLPAADVALKLKQSESFSGLFQGDGRRNAPPARQDPPPRQLRGPALGGERLTGSC